MDAAARWGRYGTESDDAGGGDYALGAEPRSTQAVRVEIELDRVRTNAAAVVLIHSGDFPGRADGDVTEVAPAAGRHLKRAERAHDAEACDRRARGDDLIGRIGERDPDRVGADGDGGLIA